VEDKLQIFDQECDVRFPSPNTNNLWASRFTHQEDAHTRGFLWQEGRTAHLTADIVVRQTLDIYRQVYERFFNHASYSRCQIRKREIRWRILHGNTRRIHPLLLEVVFLGQKYSRPEMFNIFEVEDPDDGSEPFCVAELVGIVHTCDYVLWSWSMVIIKLVLPPRVAIQAIVGFWRRRQMGKYQWGL